MRTYIHYFFLLIAAFAIVSCENDLPFSIKDNPPKLVMNALINADSLTNYVYLNLTGKEQTSHIKDATLEVRINDILTKSLRPLPVEPETPPQCRFSLNEAFSPGDVIRLDALTDDGKHHAWAEVTVPQRLEAIEKIDTLTIPYGQSGYSTIHLRHKITFKDIPGEDNYYRLIMDTRVTQKRMNENKEVIATQSWRNYNFISWEDVVLTDGQPSTGDDRENSMFDTPQNVYGVFNDSRFKNSTYTMTVYQPTYLFRGFDYNNPLIREHAEVIVRILSITETEFYYLKALNLVDSDSYDETINEPIKYPSNVYGGTGIVGVSTEVSKVIQIPDDEEPKIL